MKNIQSGLNAALSNVINGGITSNTLITEQQSTLQAILDSKGTILGKTGVVAKLIGELSTEANYGVNKYVQTVMDMGKGAKYKMNADTLMRGTLTDIVKFANNTLTDGTSVNVAFVEGIIDELKEKSYPVGSFEFALNHKVDKKYLVTFTEEHLMDLARIVDDSSIRTNIFKLLELRNQVLPEIVEKALEVFKTVNAVVDRNNVKHYIPNSHTIETGLKIYNLQKRILNTENKDVLDLIAKDIIKLQKEQRYKVLSKEGAKSVQSTFDGYRGTAYHTDKKGIVLPSNVAKGLNLINGDLVVFAKDPAQLEMVVVKVFITNEREFGIGVHPDIAKFLNNLDFDGDQPAIIVYDKSKVMNDELLDYEFKFDGNNKMNKTKVAEYMVASAKLGFVPSGVFDISKESIEESLDRKDTTFKITKNNERFIKDLDTKNPIVILDKKLKKDNEVMKNSLACLEEFVTIAPGKEDTKIKEQAIHGNGVISVLEKHLNKLVTNKKAGNMKIAITRLAVSNKTFNVGEGKMNNNVWDIQIVFGKIAVNLYLPCFVNGTAVINGQCFIMKNEVTPSTYIKNGEILNGFISTNQISKFIDMLISYDINGELVKTGGESFFGSLFREVKGSNYRAFDFIRKMIQKDMFKDIEKKTISWRDRYTSDMAKYLIANSMFTANQKTIEALNNEGFDGLIDYVSCQKDKEQDVTITNDYNFSVVEGQKILNRKNFNFDENDNLGKAMSSSFSEMKMFLEPWMLLVPKNRTTMSKIIKSVNIKETGLLINPIHNKSLSIASNKTCFDLQKKTMVSCLTLSMNTGDLDLSNLPSELQNEEALLSSNEFGDAAVYFKDFTSRITYTGKMVNENDQHKIDTLCKVQGLYADKDLICYNADYRMVLEMDLSNPTAANNFKNKLENHGREVIICDDNKVRFYAEAHKGKSDRNNVPAKVANTLIKTEWLKNDSVSPIEKNTTELYSMLNKINKNGIDELSVKVFLGNKDANLSDDLHYAGTGLLLIEDIYFQPYDGGSRDKEKSKVKFGYTQAINTAKHSVPPLYNRMLKKMKIDNLAADLHMSGITFCSYNINEVIDLFVKSETEGMVTASEVENATTSLKDNNGNTIKYTDMTDEDINAFC